MTYEQIKKIRAMQAQAGISDEHLRIMIDSITDGRTESTKKLKLSEFIILINQLKAHMNTRERMISKIHALVTKILSIEYMASKEKTQAVLDYIRKIYYVNYHVINIKGQLEQIALTENSEGTQKTVESLDDLTDHEIAFLLRKVEAISTKNKRKREAK